MTLFLTKTSISQQKIPSSHLFLVTLYFSRASLSTTSPNIGGTDAWTVPPPQILGGPSQAVPPKSLPMVSIYVYEIFKCYLNSNFELAVCLKISVIGSSLYVCKLIRRGNHLSTLNTH